jgi:hypothetical protein
MRGVTQITVDREQAQREYEAYREALKTKKDAFIHDLKVAYGHMRHGRAVLDVWHAFQEAGLDANGDPRIAIARADWRTVHFRKFNDQYGWWRDIRFQGLFSNIERTPHNAWSSGKLTDITRDDVTVPKGTWKYPAGANGEPDRRLLETAVPVVPARFLPDHALSNYYILWEVEKWDNVTPPRDPFLLKRVSPNVFVVLAGWDLTDLERAVLRGRIG